MAIKESISYEDIVFKTKSGNNFGLSNVFFDENIMLYPLYKKIKINGNDESCNVFPYNDYRLELFCPICKKRRIFCFQNSSFVKIFWSQYGEQHCEKVKDFLFKTDYFSVRAQADCKHNLLVILKKIDNSTIMKVGQYPSIYDLNEEINNKSFINMLGEEYSGYYKNACSLYSFNTCIGAMVYLKRIFEKVLLETYEEHKDNISYTFDDFKKLRMEDKIKELKKYLPDILFEQGFNSIYTKISDGVHNLSESECQLIFPILKNAIEEILIDRLELKEKQKRRKELSNKIGNL